MNTIIKLCPMSGSPLMKSECARIINEIAVKSFCIVNNSDVTRFISKKLNDARSSGKIILTSGCAVERKNGMKNILFVHPDYKIEKEDEYTLKIVNRY